MRNDKEKTIERPITELVERIVNKFDYVAEIHVAHLPTVDEVSCLVITVHTGEADSFEEPLDEFAGYHALVDVGDADPLELPVNVLATYDGVGHLQGSQGTTVYMADDVLGAEPRSLDEGLTRLRQKLAGVCPMCRERTDAIGQHYRESRDCRLDEF